MALVPTSSRTMPQQFTRRALLGAAAAVPALPAMAIFESQEQLALINLATAQPKLTSLVKEVAEVKRRRIKMAPDYEDDAYGASLSKIPATIL